MTVNCGVFHPGLLIDRSYALSPQPFMSPRYPGGPRPSLRMPNQVLTPPTTPHFCVLLLLFSLLGSCFILSFLVSASRWSPRVTAAPAKQFGPHQTARYHTAPQTLQPAVFEKCFAMAFVKVLWFLFPIRTSKHGWPNEDEPTQRNGRHGPTGCLNFLSIKQSCLDWEP